MIGALGMNRLIRLTVVFIRCRPAPQTTITVMNTAQIQIGRAIIFSASNRILSRCFRFRALAATTALGSSCIGGGQSCNAAGRYKKINPTAIITPTAE